MFQALTLKYEQIYTIPDLVSYMVENTGRGPKKKIIRVSEKYNLNNIGQELAEKWTHPDEDQRLTLKELKHHFNQEVLYQAMDNAGFDPLRGEVEYIYNYLIDDGDDPEREDIIQDLESKGLDVESVVDDFINSPQTIHNYLQQEEGVELKTGDKSPKEKSLEHIESLDRRYKIIVDDIIERLTKKGELPEGEYNVSIDCFITNTDTSDTMHIKDVLED